MAGSISHLRSLRRGTRCLRLLDELQGDARYGLRSLRRDPGFALVAVVTLGLGIGATAAIFSAIDAVLLRPLPFHEPDRLVQLVGVNIPFSWDGAAPPQTGPELGDAQALAAFSHVAAYAPGALNLSGSGAPRRVPIAAVTSDFFGALGVHPSHGRGFVAEEGMPNGPRVAVVSHSFLRRHLAGDANLAAHSIVLNGEPHAVVGVMPRAFAFPADVEVWLPLSVPITSASFEPFRQYLPSRMIARLAPGVPIERAQSMVSALHAQYDLPDRPRALRPVDQVRPLRDALVGDHRGVLLALLGATGLVLLAACVNVANLLLSRSWARRREIAIRAAIGASRARVVRQLLAESLVLALIGATAGVLVALLGTQLLGTLVPELLAGAVPLRIDARVLGFTAALALLTGVGFGLVPALGVRDGRPGDVLRGGTGADSGRRSARLRQTLVVVEVALAVTLLVGSALMLRSLHALFGTDPGVQPDRVATLELTLASAEYPTPQDRRLFYEAVIEGVTALPQVETAAIIDELPLRGAGGALSLVYPEGRRPERPDLRYMAQELGITSDYFQAMGIGVLAGRAPRPRPDSPAVREVAINVELAGMHWPGENPLGRHLERPDGQRLEIVGVVSNVLWRALDSEPIPQAYYPLLDTPGPHAAVVARGHVPAGVLARALEDAVRAAAPQQAVYNIRTMEQVMANAVAERRTNTWLMSAFGALALALAGIGVYGVISFGVTRRTREFGIRIALGARAAHVRATVVREAAVLALVGCIIGMAAARVFSRVLSGMIFGVGVRDHVAFAAAPLVVLLAAALAALLPVRRATRIEPIVAIRTE